MTFTTNILTKFTSNCESANSNPQEKNGKDDNH